MQYLELRPAYVSKFLITVQSLVKKDQTSKKQGSRKLGYAMLLQCVSWQSKHDSAGMAEAKLKMSVWDEEKSNHLV